MFSLFSDSVSMQTTIAVYETLEGIVAIPPGCPIPGSDPNTKGTQAPYPATACKARWLTVCLTERGAYVLLLDDRILSDRSLSYS